MAGWLMAAMIVGGLAGLIFGGEMFLRSATEIARRLGISESVIAITLVAGGTSLPELASSLVSLFKGKADMALGNVIGSNIANILLILGLSATIHPLSMGGITVWDLLMVVLSSVLLFLAAFTFKRRAIRPLGGRDLPGDLRRLHRVSDTIIRPQTHGSQPCLQICPSPKSPPRRDLKRGVVRTGLHQVTVDKPRHGIVAQRVGRDGHSSGGRSEWQAFRCGERPHEAAGETAGAGAGNAAHQMPRTVAQQATELRQSREVREFNGASVSISGNS